MATDTTGSVFDVRFYNILVLGISFMLIFTAFQTASMAEKSVLDSAKTDTNGTFSGNGYYSLSIIYWVFSASNWAAPSVVAFIGPKFSMIVGAVLYFLFILSFLKPMNWALYTSSVLVGFGAAILWTGQGNFLTINSDSETISRNSGIFWAILQCSLIFGNIHSHYELSQSNVITNEERTKLFIGLSGAAILGILLFSDHLIFGNIYSHFELSQGDVITNDERTKLFIGLSGAAVLGILSLFALRKKRNVDSEDLVNLNASGQIQVDTPLTALKRAFHLMKTKEMILLSFAIAYTGFELTFFSGVYGTCISNNKYFGGEAKGLIGISGIFIGVGEILGGALFGLLGKKTNRHGRDIIVVFGYVVHMVCFFLIFINFPKSSPIESLDQPTYITSNKYLAIFSAFLLGLGDSSFNTQLYSLIGFMFPEDSSPAFALFKFVQSVTAAIGFHYSGVLVLHWQLLILVIVGTIGTYFFCIVEWKSTRAHREGYRSI